MDTGTTGGSVSRDSHHMELGYKELLGNPKDANVLKQTPLERLLFTVERTNNECLDIMRSKNHDYTSGSGDVLANFKASAVLGVDPGLGILLRVQDKLKRLQTFIERGTLEVDSEGYQDAIRDVINYMHLLNFHLMEQ